MKSNFQSVDQSRSFIETARRAQIIECAILTIAELGYAQASLAKIAKRAGISAGVISYYFAGKDDLIAEVTAHVYEAGGTFIRARLAPNQSARVTLRAFIEANVAYFGVHPANAIAVMNIVRAGGAGQGGTAYDAAVGEPRRAGISAILERGQAAGEFRAFSVPVMVATLVEALDVIPPQLAANPDLDTAEYGRELAELFDRATCNDPVEDVR